MKKNLVIFTGSGISSESGIATYRAADGLWANYKIEEVCTPDALRNNRSQVIEFYNERRREMLDAQPNSAHRLLQSLEEKYNIEIITQNIDDLHERAGSTRVLHLHGELGKLCSSRDVSQTVDLDGWKQSLEARHADGSLLRPHIVFFNEQVPRLDQATTVAKGADIFVVIGTSLQVYPAASLVYYVNPGVPVFVIDPQTPTMRLPNNSVTVINEPATIGVQELIKKYL